MSEERSLPTAADVQRVWSRYQAGVATLEDVATLALRMEHSDTLLREYGDHTAACDIFDNTFEGPRERECTCGYEERVLPYLREQQRSW